MVDSVNLSKLALELIKSRPSDGQSMIAISRAVLSGNFNDEIYNTDFLDIFQLICDDSDEIALSGFGEFNSIQGKKHSKLSHQSDQIITEIHDFYFTKFEQSVSNFRNHYRI